MSMSRDGRFQADRELLGADGIPPDGSIPAGIAAMALELEMLAAQAPVRSTPEFHLRVAGAIAAEPMPAPAAAARFAVGRHSLRGFISALGDAGRVAFGAGRPLMVRGQAFALLLIVLLGVLSAGGVAAAGAAQLLAPAPATPNHATPTIPPSPRPSLTAEPVATPHVTASQPVGAQPARTSEPDGPAGPVETPRSSEAPKPGDTGTPPETPKPGETPRPSESDGGAQSHGDPGRTP